MSVSVDMTCILYTYTALAEQHLRYLLQDTIDAQVKWYCIGLFLGLPPSILDAIREDMDTTTERYIGVLKHWLKTGEATMKKLSEALESNVVNEKGLASCLRKKYANRIAPQNGIALIIHL